MSILGEASRKEASLPGPCSNLQWDHDPDADLPMDHALRQGFFNNDPTVVSLFGPIDAGLGSSNYNFHPELDSKFCFQGDWCSDGISDAYEPACTTEALSVTDAQG